MYCIYHKKKKKGGEDDEEENEKRYQIVKNILQKMGCREYQLMAQQVQETVYQV